MLNHAMKYLIPVAIIVGLFCFAEILYPAYCRWLIYLWGY